MISSPIISSAPGRLSTMNGCPQACDSACPIARARMSVMAPGEVGTMILTARLGYCSCARPTPAAKFSASIAPRSTMRMRMIPPY